MNCIFCKIIKNEISAHKIYEDEHVLAFLDISQATYGHTLVIPKKHYENLFEIDEVELQKVIVIAKKIALKLKKELNVSGINLINNNGKQAGQTVFHYHIHLIPRYDESDGYNQTFINNINKYDLNKLACALKFNV